MMGNHKKKYNAKRNSRRHVYHKGRVPGHKQSHDLSADRAEDNEQSATTIQGSRIINIEQLQHYSDELARHSACCTESIVLNGESQDGLESILSASCSICNHTIKLETSKKVKGPKGYRR